MSKRFDPETQAEIDNLYHFILRTAARSEWEFTTKIHSKYDHYMYWRHVPTGIILTGRRESRSYEYQPYDLNNTDLYLERPFSRSQRRSIKRALGAIYAAQKQREKHEQLANFMAATRQQQTSYSGAALLPDEKTIEKAATQTMEWVAKGGKQPPNAPPPPTSSKQPPEPPKTSGNAV